MKLSEIKPNPNNPRAIKGEKFDKLVKSIEGFPKMMNLRPIIIDQNNIILGGNMRYDALKKLGYKQIPDECLKRAEELTDEEKRQFIIKDNVGFGDWDWELLSAEWDSEELEDWGLDVWDKSTDINSLTEDELDLTEEFDPIGDAKGLQRVVFIFDGSEEAESYLNNLNVEFKKRNMAWQVNMSSQSI